MSIPSLGTAFIPRSPAGVDRSLPGERRAVDRRTGNGPRPTDDRVHGEPMSHAPLSPAPTGYAPATPAPTSDPQVGRDVATPQAFPSNVPYAGVPGAGPHQAAPGDRANVSGGMHGQGRPEPGEAPGFAAGPVCTAPQLRRFIKSRPYVPMHELRRRFGINGTEDEVTGIDLGSSRIYVGLPGREGSLLGELLRGGEVGYELSLDPRTPIVIGLYPMRPVARS
jgi:hypothetical protein